MKLLQSLKDAADRLGDHAPDVRRILHTVGRGALKSRERRDPVASRPKIEVVRDICAQPADLPGQLNRQSFPQFVQFPAEIRLLIWHFASTAGRVVELQWSDLELGFRNCAAPRPPAVLHTCRDSRKEALKIFRPYFGMRGRRKPIYVDPVNDVLFFRLPPWSFSWRWRLEWMYRPDRPRRVKEFREELKGIRRVAFLWRNIERDAMPFSDDPFGMLPDVEEFMILWADWYLRTFEGRGVNFIEGISPCVHHVQHDARQMTRTLKDWEQQLTKEYSGKRPVLTLRHWCLREEE